MAFTQGSTLLATVIVARCLGKEEFGQFAVLYSTLLTISTIAQFSIGVTATKFIAESRLHDKPRAGRILGFASLFAMISGAIGAAALVLLGPWLAEQQLGVPQMGSLFIQSSGFVLFSVMAAYQIGAISGLHGQKILGITSLPAGLVHVVALTVGALEWGLNGAVLGLVASSVFRWALQAAALKRETSKCGITRDIPHAWIERTVLTRFALPSALAGLSTLPALWITQIILASHPGGFNEVGIYSAANNLRTMVLFLPLALNSVGTALLNAHWGAKEEVGYRHTFWKNLTFSVILLVGGVGIVIMMATQALTVFGKDFAGHGAEFVVTLMVVAALPEGLAVCVYQIIQSQAKMWTSLWFVALPRDLIFIVSAYHLIPIHGAIGLAISYLLAQLISFITITTISSRIGLTIKET